MSLFSPERVPVGFALDRRRATANMEAGERRFPRFSRIHRPKISLIFTI